jgi:hypothetical protein
MYLRKQRQIIFITCTLVKFRLCNWSWLEILKPHRSEGTMHNSKHMSRWWYNQKVILNQIFLPKPFLHNCTAPLLAMKLPFLVICIEQTKSVSNADKYTTWERINCIFRNIGWLKASRSARMVAISRRSSTHEMRRSWQPLQRCLFIQHSSCRGSPLISL